MLPRLSLLHKLGQYIHSCQGRGGIPGRSRQRVEAASLGPDFCLRGARRPKARLAKRFTFWRCYPLQKSGPALRDPSAPTFYHLRGSLLPGCLFCLKTVVLQTDCPPAWGWLGKNRLGVYENTNPRLLGPDQRGSNVGGVGWDTGKYIPFFLSHLLIQKISFKIIFFFFCSSPTNFLR